MRDFFGVLRRRWTWAVAGLLLILGGVAAVLSVSPPSYSYSATVVLLPPEISRAVDPSAPDYTKSNPLFFLGTLGQARDILVGALTSKDVQDTLQDAYPGISYEASADVLGTGPIVVITTESAVKQEASDGLDALLQSVEEQLSTLQSDLGIRSEEALVTSHVLTRDTSPALSHKGQIRRALLVGAALGLFTLFAIGIGDALLSRRRGRGEDHEEVAR